MPITFGNVTTRFSTTDPTSSENINVPAGAVAGVDWYVLIASSAPAVTWNVPAGFDSPHITLGNATGGRSVIAWKRKATGSEGATFTVSTTAATASIACACIVVKPTDSTFSLDVDVVATPTDSAGASVATVTFPNITTGVANTVLIRASGTNLSAGTTNALSTPASHTERADSQTSAATGARTHLAVYTIAQAAAGASGSPTGTLTTARPWQTITFSIKETAAVSYHPFLDRRRRSSVAFYPR